MEGKGKLIIILLLNLITGGFGTIFAPFLFKTKKKEIIF